MIVNEQGKFEFLLLIKTDRRGRKKRDLPCASVTVTVGVPGPADWPSM